MGYLGIAYSSWLASLKHHDIICYEKDLIKIQSIKLEDNLYNLWNESISNKYILLTNDYKKLANSDVILFTYDTPIDSEGNTDLQYISNKINELVSNIKHNIPIIICSQIPVGTIAKFESLYPKNHFIYIPENVRVGKALDYLFSLDRIILGTRHDYDESLIKQILTDVNANVPIIKMSPESAEMTKHTINSFLATNIAFINEMAKICKYVDADINDVVKGIRSEYRIGSKLPLLPGGPFRSGHLERDLGYLCEISYKNNLSSDLLRSITISNNKVKNECT